MFKKLKIQDSWLKTFIFILILVFYASIATHQIALPVYDDLPRQIKIGEEIVHGNFDILYKNTFSYTEPDQTFYNHHWLSGVVFYLLHVVLGWSGLVIFKVFILLLFFSILFFTALKKADFWLVSIVSIPTILILSERTGLRPEIFSYLFISVFLYILFYFEEKPKSRIIYWLIPLQLLWVNSHVFFSIGIMLVAGFLLEKIIYNHRELWFDFSNTLKKNDILKKLIIVFLCIIAVSFINPRGVDGVFYHYDSEKLFPVIIGENQSIYQFEKGMTPWRYIPVSFFKLSVVFLILSIFFYIFSNRKKLSQLNKIPIFYILAILSTSLLGFIILRAVSLFAIIFLLSFSFLLNSYFVFIKDKFLTKHPKLIKILPIIFIILLIFLSLPKNRDRISTNTIRGTGLTYYSNGSARFFIDNKLKGPIFNDADIGSYLIFHLYPQEKVFNDNRFADAYSPELFNEYFDAVNSEDKWLEFSKKYDFQTIFFYQYDGGDATRNFLWRRLRDPAWVLVYVDMYGIIFVRNLPENKELLDRYKITRENVGEKLKHLFSSDEYVDLITFADICNLLGRVDLGSDAFLKIVYEWPERSHIWMIMGEWELSRDQYRSHLLAMMYLEKAISLGQKSAEAYYYLGLVYDKLGQREKAIDALEKALKINPDRRDAKDLLYQLDGRTR